jgi:hypothetical protein
MTTPPPPEVKPKVSAETLAYEIRQLRVEHRVRDLQTLRAGNSLVISGLVVMLIGLGGFAMQDPTPFFIGVALLCAGFSKQRQGTTDYSEQYGQ